MRRFVSILALLAFSLAALPGSALAIDHPEEKGTLVSVLLHGTSSPADNYPDAQPGRVPPGPVTYTYEFTVRVGCTEHVGLYDSFQKKFAAHFSPGEQVQVRLTKRVLYITAPGMDETLRMPFSGHHAVEGCTAK